MIGTRRTLIQKISIPDGAGKGKKARRVGKKARLQAYLPFITLMVLGGWNYFYTQAELSKYDPYSAFVRVFSIAFFNIVFALLEFYMNKRPLKAMTFFAIFLGIFLYAAPVIIEGVGTETPHPLFVLWELLTLVVFSIFSPGIALLMLGLFKKIKQLETSAKLANKPHVHESFIGSMFLLGGFIVFLAQYMSKLAGTWEKIILLQDVVLALIVFFFLFAGIFAVARDWSDFTLGKFIEKPKKDGIEKIYERHPLNFHLPQDKFYRVRMRSPLRLLIAIAIPLCVSAVVHSFGIIAVIPSAGVIELNRLITAGFIAGLGLGGLFGYMEAHVLPYQYFFLPG